MKVLISDVTAVTLRSKYIFCELILVDDLICEMCSNLGLSGEFVVVSVLSL